MNRKIHRYSEADARKIIKYFLDEASFSEIFPPTERIVSPNLVALDLPVQFDDGVVTGIGKLNGNTVFMAAQQGAFDGGSIGEVQAAKLVGLLKRAQRDKPAAVIFAFDSGGVRLHEANIGLIAVAELVRAVLDTRSAGIPCIAMIGGNVGCYGGASIAAKCFDHVIMSERGRLGVSGPIVIETVLGVEEFDSKDRALVWRTFGGRHRYITGDADEFADDDIASFREIASGLLNPPEELTLDALKKEHRILAERYEKFGNSRTACDIWKVLGVGDSSSISMTDANSFREKCAAARSEKL